MKRHPTIGDNVTIYSNSTVLGGETVIGENTIIGGNTFITSSIPANTKVSAKSPELVIKKPRNTVSKADVWDWENSSDPERNQQETGAALSACRTAAPVIKK